MGRWVARGSHRSANRKSFASRADLAVFEGNDGEEAGFYATGLGDGRYSHYSRVRRSLSRAARTITALFSEPTVEQHN